jgi:hypothetical protein
MWNPYIGSKKYYIPQFSVRFKFYPNCIGEHEKNIFATHLTSSTTQKKLLDISQKFGQDPNICIFKPTFCF